MTISIGDRVRLPDGRVGCYVYEARPACRGDLFTSRVELDDGKAEWVMLDSLKPASGKRVQTRK